MAWSWPWRSRLPQRSRQPTADAMLKRAEAETKVAKTKREDERDRIAHEALVTRAASDERFALAYLEKYHGIKVPMTPEKSLEDQIYEEALENDPVLKARIVEARAREKEMKGGSPITRRIDDTVVQLLDARPDLLMAAAEKRIATELGNITSTDPLEAAMVMMERLEALKKHMGAGDTPWWQDMAANSLPQVLAIVAANMGGRQGYPQLPAGQQVIEVGDNGPEPTIEQPPPRVTRPTARRQEPDDEGIMPLVAGETTKPVVVQPPVQHRPPVARAQPPQPQAISSSETIIVEEQEKSGALNVSEWVKYIDDDPEYLVSAIAEMCEYGSQAGIAAAKTLMKYDTASDLISFLIGFTKLAVTPDDVKDAIMRLQTSEAWLDKVMELAKQDEVIKRYGAGSITQ